MSEETKEPLSTENDDEANVEDIDVSPAFTIEGEDQSYHPVVRVLWNGQPKHLSTNSARTFGLTLLRAADMSETDAFIATFAKKKGLDPGKLVRDWQEERDRLILEGDRE